MTETPITDGNAASDTGEKPPMEHKPGTKTPFQSGTVIDFGVPELDELFGRLAETRPQGMYADPGESLTICILGADGTGKSVLALHLASRYAARRLAPVIYFSEDLGYKRAERVFRSFGLDKPQDRCSALRLPEFVGCRADANVELEEVKFEPGPANVSDEAANVQFVDLQGRTTGDDWSFVLEMIASLPTKAADERLACVILDNVDALQLVNAGVDQFGEERSRWSRLDQLTIIAKHRCHVVLISGEPGPDYILDEQYNADYVLHLYVRAQEGYEQLTLKVEKARGQANTRGPHAFAFRSGFGTTTGYQENPDNQRTTIYRAPVGPIAGEPNGQDPDNELKPTGVSLLSYVRVFHSLDYVYSKYMASEWTGYVPGTGSSAHTFKSLDLLNDLIPGSAIRGGAITTVIGPRGTFKGSLVSSLEASRIGEPFLSADVEAAVRGLTDAENATPSDDKAEKLRQKYAAYREAVRAQDSAGSPFSIVHLTTEDVDSWQIAHRVARWVNADVPRAEFEATGRYGTPGAPNKANVAYIEARVICRRLEIHANSAAVLFSIIRDCVDAGIKQAFSRPDKLDRREAGRVIVTIGDWSQIEERYPDVAKESKFLPLLLFHLRREGVTTLITESHGETRALPSIYQSRSRLAQNADQAIYTWRVLGDSRVAISVTPQLSDDGRALVRELRARQGLPGLTEIKPSLERYHGFETGDPRPVKLYLRLLGQTSAQQEYARNMATLLKELSEGEQSEGALVEATDELEYDLLRDVAFLLADAQLSHTQLLMVDEFWEVQHTVRNLDSYMADLPREKPTERFFRGEGSRLEAFNNADRQINLSRANGDPFLLKEDPSGDRVPYTWDFGFILTRPNEWRNAYQRMLPSLKAMFQENTRNPDYQQPCYIRSVGKLLRFARRVSTKGGGDQRYDHDRFRSTSTGPYQRRIENAILRKANKPALEPDKALRHNLIGWRVFLEACCVVADASGLDGLRPFDIDLTATETLSATVLEIWLSELAFILERVDKEDPEAKRANDLLSRVIGPVTGNNKASIPRLLENLWCKVALYFAIRLLAQVFEPDMLVAGSSGFDIGPRRPFPAAAVRHWYATAVRSTRDDRAFAYGAMRLPGSFTTRGDWHLAVAAGSRSIRLGYDALDKLSSVRANFDRLQLGVGLPTRAVPEPEYVCSALSTIETPTAATGLTYHNLVSLGATNDPSFHWIFRSRLEGYRYHSTPFRKWVFRVLRQWVAQRTARLPGWTDAFEEYDNFVLARTLVAPTEGNLPRFAEFDEKELKKLLNIELKASLERM